MMTNEGSTKIINLMTSEAGVLVLACCHISCIVKMHYFILKDSSLVLDMIQTN